MPPGSDSGGGKEFLHEAHRRGLWVTEFPKYKQTRKDCGKLLEDFPTICVTKFGKDNLQSGQGRGKMVVGLVNKHSGELVELDRSRPTWVLRRAPGQGAVAPKDEEQGVLLRGW